MAIVRNLKTVDSKCRITIPRQVLEEVGLSVGDAVYFDITKTGGIIIRKYEPKKESL